MVSNLNQPPQAFVPLSIRREEKGVRFSEGGFAVHRRSALIFGR